MEPVRTLLTMAVGAVTGLLGGTFGKGGSAIASPLLAAVGVRPFAALASPLPATIPATLIAAYAYVRAGYVDRTVLRTTVAVGVPATVVGALLSGLVGGGPLVLVCDIVLALLGLRILTSRRHAATSFRPPGTNFRFRAQNRSFVPPTRKFVTETGTETTAGTTLVAASAENESREPTLGGGTPRVEEAEEGPDRGRLVAVGVVVGLASGLLANSGGFLLAPLFMTFLGLPLKRALGTSLGAAAALAVPGTIVHVAMGHVDWSVAVPFALASVPLSATGARLALRTDADRLTTAYGVALLVLGLGLLAIR